MRIEKRIKDSPLIEIKDDIKIGNTIIEKGDSIKILKEERKWNSGFRGYVIIDVAQANVRRLEPILQDYDVTWDALLDMGWTQMITDVEDKDQWDEIATEIRLKTGINVHDAYKNQ